MTNFKPITNLGALNEAYHYEKPSCFSRGLSYTMGDSKFIYISGTASIDSNGQSVFIDDFENQLLKTFDNITMLLQSEKATWKDVIKTTVYIKDMESHYGIFNELRKKFFESKGVDLYPASTCVQATMCRPELLVEIDAIAIVKL